MSDNQTTGVFAEIVAERKRQIGAEGRTPKHDDQHLDGEMAAAASCYAMNASGKPGMQTDVRATSVKPFWVPRAWPWEFNTWKPSTSRRDLVKAAALIVAEIERLDRAAAKRDTQTTAPIWPNDVQRRSRLSLCHSADAFVRAIEGMEVPDDMKGEIANMVRLAQRMALRVNDGGVSPAEPMKVW